MHLLQRAFQSLKAISEKRDTPLPKNTGKSFNNRRLDCAVFEILHHLRGADSFDTVAAYFVEGGEIYPGAAIRSLDHVQICVRNPAKILGYFLSPSR